LEQYDYRLHRGYQPAFDQVPREHRHRLFGVDYVHIKGRQGGDLFVTRHGWGCVESVLPQAWFVDDRFCKVGRALAGATGAVYRVPVPHRACPDYALVVKFSRAAQDIRVTIVDAGPHLDAKEQEQIEQAEFLSPFEEFGNLCRLRAQAGSEVLTAQPLAIYSPPTRYLDWQLGRKSYICYGMSAKLLASQKDVPEERRVAYDWERLYVLLYRWVDGIDAEAAMLGGAISRGEMVRLGQDARATLRRHGWMACDHKPRHVILRPVRKGNGFLLRNAVVKWALIDYELLVPLPDGHGARPREASEAQIAS
jgi:hypothetical protein